ncbi:MAG: hypothetical protein Kow0029_30290 [Candidatus Rifleibacteriota bacterium]
MKNPLLEKWEDKLQNIFNKIDDILEQRYGHLYPLRPNRPAHKKGVTSDADGLFDLGVSFTPGFGSQFGPGYVFRVKLATLNRVPKEMQKKLEDEVVDLLQKELPKEFPGKELRVARDGVVYKIYGDLDLN